MESFFCYRSVSIVALLVFLICCSSCVSTPGDTGEDMPVSAPVEKTPVSLPVPEQTNHGYFAAVDSAVIADVETGSPASLLSAVARLKRAASSYTEAEKVLLSIASSLMTIVWPSEKNTVDVPAGGVENNLYTAAIESAKIGLYDENTGNGDFFALVLPSLVLLSGSSSTSYYDLSRAALDAARQMNNGSVLVMYLSGCLHEKQRDYVAALADFEQAAAAAPGVYEIQYARCRVYLAMGEYSKALSLAETLLLQFPKDLKLLKMCTDIALEQKNYTVAEQYIMQVLQQEPENTSFLLYRIEVLIHQENYIKAASLLDVYARTDSSSKDYLLLRAQIQSDWNRNTAAAAATLEEALLLYPDDADVILSAAKLAAETGSTVRGKSAGSLASQILEQDAGNLQALEICTEDAVFRKSWEYAYSYSSRLIQQPEPDMSVLLRHVSICLNTNRLTEAENMIVRLYQENPGLETVQEMYIRTLVATGKTSAAGTLIGRLLPGASSQMKSFLYYQRSFLQSGSSARLSDLRQSLTANPRNPEPLFEMYRYYYDNKDYRKAQYYLKQVVALNPSDGELLKFNEELEDLLAR